MAVSGAHFKASLQFETDCADVTGALASGTPGFVLLDVRSPALFARGHVPSAVNLPLGKIVASNRGLFARHALRDLLRGTALQRRDTRCDTAGSVGTAGEGDDRWNYRLARRRL